MRFMSPYYLAQQERVLQSDISAAIKALGFKPAVISLAMGHEQRGFTEKQVRAILTYIKRGKKTKVPREGPWLEGSEVAGMCGYQTSGLAIQRAKEHGIKLDYFMIGPGNRRFFWTEKAASQLCKAIARHHRGQKSRKEVEEIAKRKSRETKT